VTGPELTVGRGVIAEMVTIAALGIPGVIRVSRGGPRWLAALAGPPVITQVSGDAVRVRVWVVARPGQAIGQLTGDVRAAVSGAVERLLGLRLESVVVTVDGVGG
jgi:uncharacterized alkaline shock family protein YloU